MIDTMFSDQNGIKCFLKITNPIFLKNLKHTAKTYMDQKINQGRNKKIYKLEG